MTTQKDSYGNEDQNRLHANVLLCPRKNSDVKIL